MRLYTPEMIEAAKALKAKGLEWVEVALEIGNKFGIRAKAESLRKLVHPDQRDSFAVYRQRKEIRAEHKANDELQNKLETTQRELRAVLALKSTPQTYQITSPKPTKLTATAFVVASDWHVEETILGRTVNQLNEFNLKIADERINRFFSNTVRLLKVQGTDTQIDGVVLALLGDFISGNIHEELLENTELRPIEAIVWVQDRLLAGIRHLLANTPYKYTIVCHPGNHSRITRQVHISTEEGNSLEILMYHTLRNLLKDESRITWIIAEGYHTYLDLYGYTIRLHHGHSIKYSGGVGGLTIPANKKIAQWNKSKSASLDLFGHYHQQFNGGNFICNGSLIGYNAYALRIGASWERPRQKFFMFASHGEVIAEFPIFLE